MLFFIYLLSFLLNFVKSKQPNIILFLTDDQDLILNGMMPMKNVQKYIANKGVTFTNAFVNAPICCPSRSSILTGQYPHNHGVKNNSYSGNCAGKNWQEKSEQETIAVALAKIGYTNFYAGKYLNQYGTKEAGGPKHVPKGWTDWYGLVGNSKYYNYTLSENGKAKRYKDVYLTDLLATKAVDFIKQNKEPYFMILAPPAPHAPFTPAKRHIGKFSNTQVLRTPSFNYTPHEKHWLLQMSPIHLPTNVEILDHVTQKRYESLLAVDEMVGKVVETLTDLKQIDNTYIFFTSDNGFHIGQFGQPWDKRQPYDTDIRVPLLVRAPNGPQKILQNRPIQSIDITPTIFLIAHSNIDEIPSHIDGSPFLDEITSNYEQKNFPTANILIEYHGEGNIKSNDPKCEWSKDQNLAECSSEFGCKCQDSRNNTYNCVREIGTETDFLFCQMFDDQNFIEAYDMTHDLYQLDNIYKKMSTEKIKYYHRLLNKLRQCKGVTCKNI